MKLPSIITGAVGAHGRAGQANTGDGKSADNHAGFDHVLSDLRTKATGMLDPAQPPARSAATTSGASERKAKDMHGRDVAPDAAVDRLLKRVGGDDAPEGATSADPILSLVTPAAGLQMVPTMPAREPMPQEPESTSQAQMPGAPAQMADATVQTAPTTAKQPLICDVSVASRFAPTTPVLPATQAEAPLDAGRGPSARPAGMAVVNQIPSADRSAAMLVPSRAASDSVGEAIVAVAGRPAAGQTIDETAPSSSGDRSRPPSSAAVATAVAVTAAAPPEAQTGGDGRSPSSSLAVPSRPAVEIDRATPDEDATSSFLGATVPASVESPPAAVLSALSPPVRQVAAALTQLVEATSAASSAAPAPDPSTPRPAVARTLTLQISPASLGTVAVRMHASGGALDVQLTASDPQTASLLSRERDALAASLQDRHTTLHSLVIQDGSGGSQPGGHHATQGDTSDAQARAQRGGSDAGSGGDGRQRRERPEGQPQRRASPDSDRVVPRVPSGGAGRALLV